MKALEKGGGGHHVIVRTKPGFRDAVREAMRARGADIEGDHPAVEAFTAKLDDQQLLDLLASDAVESLSVDAEVQAGGHVKKQVDKKVTVTKRVQLSRTVNASVGLLVRDELRDTLGVPENGLSGNGITVAVIDSGIQPSWDFLDGSGKSRIAAFYDFRNGHVPAGVYDQSRQALVDEYGHGTHVAGLIGGSGYKSDYRYQGVAPGVRFISMKVLGKDGRGKTSDVLNAINFAIQHKAKLSIDIINLSLGHPVFEPAATDPLVRAVGQAVRHHIIVVVSAGNNGVNATTGQPGYAGITSPGNAPWVITVGSMKTFGTVDRGDDKVSVFSSRGPTWIDGYQKPDIVAPGEDLVSVGVKGSTLFSLLPQRLVKGKGTDTSPKYLKLSGTSMAAAVTTGVVALMLEANWDAHNPPLTTNAVKAILQYTAIRVPDGSDFLTQGGGGVNADGAVRVAGGIDLVQRKPFDPFVGNAFSNIVGGGYLWTQNIVWGSYVFKQGTSTALVDGKWAPADITGVPYPFSYTYTNKAGQEVTVTLPAWWDDNIVWGTLYNKGDGFVFGSADEGDNIVWGTVLDDNIVWGTVSRDDDNIVWGGSVDTDGDNIVWGTNIVWSSNIVWGNSLIGTPVNGPDGTTTVVWGQVSDPDNIVWGSLFDDNIVWGNLDGDNIVWGNLEDGDNIVWGNAIDDGDNIVWGNLEDGDNIVWGNAIDDDDNIVWGNSEDGDNIVWGNGVLTTPKPGSGK